MVKSKKPGKTTPAPEKTPESRIPTLTEVVAPGPATAARPPAGQPAAKETPAPAPAPLDQRTLEKLIYRQLSRRLPQLSRDLASDILAELADKRGAGTGKE